MGRKGGGGVLSARSTGWPWRRASAAPASSTAPQGSRQTCCCRRAACAAPASARSRAAGPTARSPVGGAVLVMVRGGVGAVRRGVCSIVRSFVRLRRLAAVMGGFQEAQPPRRPHAHQPPTLPPSTPPNTHPAQRTWMSRLMSDPQADRSSSPTKALPRRYRSRSRDPCAHSARGTVPSKLFESRARCSKVVRRPRPGGIVPSSAVGGKRGRGGGGGGGARLLAGGGGGG